MNKLLLAKAIEVLGRLDTKPVLDPVSIAPVIELPMIEDSRKSKRVLSTHPAERRKRQRRHKS